MTDDIQFTLGRVEGKLDALIATSGGLTERVNVLSEDQNKLHTRVTVLEARRFALKEWFAVLLAVVAAAGTVFTNLKGIFH